MVGLSHLLSLLCVELRIHTPITRVTCHVLPHNKIASNFSLLLTELLDEEEFGEASESTAYDENSTNPAMELGLMVGNMIS